MPTHVIRIEAYKTANTSWVDVGLIDTAKIYGGRWSIFGEELQYKNESLDGISPVFCNHTAYPRLRLTMVDAIPPVTFALRIPYGGPAQQVTDLTFGHPQEFSNFIGQLNAPSWGYCYGGTYVIPTPTPPTSYRGMAGDIGINPILDITSRNVQGALEEIQADLLAIQSVDINKFVGNEIPGGIVDGFNGTFTLAFIPIPDSVKLYQGGQLLFQGVDDHYTLSGQTITIAFPPVAGAKLRAFYIKS